MIFTIIIIEYFGITDKIIDKKFCFSNSWTQSASSTSHLCIFNGRICRTQHNKIFYFFVIVSCIQHINRDGDDWQRVELELIDDWPWVTIIGIACNLLCKILANLAGGAIDLAGNS